MDVRFYYFNNHLLYLHFSFILRAFAQNKIQNPDELINIIPIL